MTIQNRDTREGPVAVEGTSQSTVKPPRNGISTQQPLDSAMDNVDIVAEPVAITGMAMRLPGRISTAEALWDFLIKKKSARCRVPSNRFHAEAFLGTPEEEEEEDQERENDHLPEEDNRKSKEKQDGGVRATPTSSPYGCFLDDIDITRIDTSFWSMTLQEAESLAPAQRLMLEVTKECLDNAGARLNQNVDEQVGCYIGSFGDDWEEIGLKDEQSIDMYRVTGSSDFMDANRISYEFGFQGPSMTVRTACSSSLTTLHQACVALARHECTSALVGGTSLLLTPSMTLSLISRGVLSPTGTCKPFDASADGYARADGIVALYVKRLSDAVAHGDPIRAVIRASCLNTGSDSGVSFPSSAVQERLMRNALAVAGLGENERRRMAMIECHATGTKIGDPVETRAIAKVYGDVGIYIGSLRSNLGHAEAASGLSSVVKMVLALEKRIIPPNIHFQNPNPLIPFQEAKLVVPVEPMPWPTYCDERVAVNSFGMGGANAHVILESGQYHGYTKIAKDVRDAGDVIYGENTKDFTNNEDVESPSSTPALLLFTAHHPSALRRSFENHMKYLDSHPAAIHDMSYTLCTRRQVLSHRAFCVTSATAKGVATEALSPIRRAMKRPADAIWVFTGQGAQWAGMGKDLITAQPIFRNTIRALDSYLASEPFAPAWKLEEELQRPSGESRLFEPEVAQPCCTAIQVALVDLFSAWGISPAVVLGHSSGEIAAAYAAKVLDQKQAILIAYCRGLAVAKSPSSGEMAAIGLSHAEVQCYLEPGVEVGCENSPQSVTLTGDVDCLRNVMQRIRTSHPDLTIRWLHTGVAYHSAQMHSVAHAYGAMLQGRVHAQDPSISFISSVKGRGLYEQEVKEKILSASYWVQNLVSPVLFRSAIKCALDLLVASSSVVFVEIGPHSALASPIRQNLLVANTPKSQEIDYIPTLLRNSPAGSGIADVLTMAGQLWLRQIPIDLDQLLASSGTSNHGRVLTDLPPYSWQYDGHYWAENRLSRSWRFREAAEHDLLGLLMTDTATKTHCTWRKILRLEHLSWLKDHEIADRVVFPAAAFIAMVGEAMAQLHHDTKGYRVRQLHIPTALILSRQTATEVLTHVHLVPQHRDHEGWYALTISSLDHNQKDHTSWTTHVTGQVKHASLSASPTLDIHGLYSSLPRQLASDRLYQALQKCGLHYGPEFRRLIDISAEINTHRAVARLKPTKGHVEHARKRSHRRSRYQLEPTAIDACFQLFYAALCKGLPRFLGQLVVPTYIEEILVQEAFGEVSFSAELTSSHSRILSGSLKAVTTNGAPVIVAHGFQMSPMGKMSRPAIELQDPHAAVTLEWKADLNFLDPARILQPAQTPAVTSLELDVERFALACILETTIGWPQIIQDEPRHLVEYRHWMEAQKSKAFSNIQEDGGSIISLSSVQRQQMIETTFHELCQTNTTTAVLAQAIYLVYSSGNQLFSELGRDTLEMLLQNEILIQFSDVVACRNYSQFLELVAHRNPLQSVLEIGAGTGNTTSIVLRSLQSDYGERMYSSYTFTDRSDAFLPVARERFKTASAFNYAVLDIEMDPIEQDFQHASFDLVIIGNIRYATSNITRALNNIQKLLRPGGRLLLQEPNLATELTSYVLGIFPEWCIGELGDHARLNEPYPDTSEQWCERFKSAGGFDEKVTVVSDSKRNSIIVATLWEPEDKITKKITVLQRHINPIDSVLSCTPHPILAILGQLGYHLDFCTLDDSTNNTLPPNQPILSLIDLQQPFLSNMTEADFALFQNFLSRNTNSPILWLTGSAQLNCHDPHYALILGMARTLRSELHMDFGTLELEVFDESSWIVVADVLEQFLLSLQQRKRERRQDGSRILHLNPVMEYVFANGMVMISLFHWFSIRKAILGNSEEELDGNKDWDDKTPKGIINTRPEDEGDLYWEPPSRLQGLEVPPGEVDGNWVEVKPVCVGLDIGHLHKEEYGNRIPKGVASEPCGIVKRTGPGVKNLCTGDRAFCISSTGHITTSFVVNEMLCAKLPESLSFAQGATLSYAFGTAIYALMDIGRLQKKQAILIHSAGSGVGMACIQIAQMIEAEIFCTAGTKYEADFLFDVCGIPRNKIFNWRDSSFLHDLIIATGSRGVDVVLESRSLGRDVSRASWKCVAEFGIVIKVIIEGPNTTTQNMDLSIDLLRCNRSLVTVDLLHVCSKRPSVMSSLLVRITKYIQKGLVKPLAINKEFDLEDVGDALQYLQQETNQFGKVILTTMPARDLQLASNSQQLHRTKSHLQKNILVGQPQNQKLHLRPDRNYLLVGGLGGLGRAIASWLVENGARYLTFFSRSAGSLDAADPYLRELRAQGCTVRNVSGDVCHLEDVYRVVRESELPFAGVVQGVMVLNDVPFPDMSFHQWHATTLPKVQGTQNLHTVFSNGQEFQRSPLDFFVLLSSISGLAGNPSQANYASANTYLNAVVSYRHSLGLPASVIDIGFVGDIGYLSQLEHAGISNRLRASGLLVLEEKEFLDALEFVIGGYSDVSVSSSSSSYCPGRYAASVINETRRFSTCNHIAIGIRSTLPISSSQNRTMWKKDARMAIYYNLEPSIWPHFHVQDDDFQSGVKTQHFNPNADSDRVEDFIRTHRSNPQLLLSDDSIVFLAHEIGRILRTLLLFPPSTDVSSASNEGDVDSLISLVAVDSLVSMELRSWFRGTMGIQFSLFEVTSCGTLLEFGERAARKLVKRLEACD